MKVVDLKEIELPSTSLGEGVYGKFEVFYGAFSYNNGFKKEGIFAKKVFSRCIDYENEKSINLYLRTATIKNNIDCICAAFFYYDSIYTLYMDYVAGYTLHSFIEKYKKINNRLFVGVFHHLHLLWFKSG